MAQKSQIHQQETGKPDPQRVRNARAVEVMTEGGQKDCEHIKAIQRSTFAHGPPHLLGRQSADLASGAEGGKGKPVTMAKAMPYPDDGSHQHEDEGAEGVLHWETEEKGRKCEV